ncbi:MAG TPA: dephospho-CoA kinase [Chloroflexi bacterium]|nr:dephospho-CoA kinase [Chloroflexota bacterium]
MGAWAGKYVIGLTGNIATGKSVVRRMLEHLGAYGIDADALAHRAISKGAPGYQQVVDFFGRWILAPDGQIDRAKLGRIVFADEAALRQLEAIVHPLVRQAIQILAQRAPQKVIVIEAIKLLESPLREMCDSIWVTHVPKETQIQRLVSKRKMSPEEALQRVEAQTPQAEKRSAADVIIYNQGSFEDTWKQVVAAWQQIAPEITAEEEQKTVPLVKGELRVEKARPRQAEEIASFINTISDPQPPLERMDIMAAFGEKAYMLLRMEGELVGVVGWQVENLVTRVDEVYFSDKVPLSQAVEAIFPKVEAASRELQSEAALVFLPPDLAQHEALWNAAGYERRVVEELGVRAWQDAARETMPMGTVLHFKQLRKDRVLRPI